MVNGVRHIEKEAEFRGSTREAIVDIREDVKDLKSDIYNLKKWVLGLTIAIGISLAERAPDFLKFIANAMGL